MHSRPTFSLLPTTILLTSEDCDRFRQHLNWMPDMLMLSNFGLKCKLKVFESYYLLLASICILLLFIIIAIKMFSILATLT